MRRLYRQGMLLGLWVYTCMGAFFSFSDDVVVSFTPSISVPVGPTIPTENLQLFSVGGGLGLKGTYIPSVAPFLYGRSGVEVGFSPLNKAKGMVTFLYGGGNGGINYNLFPWLLMRLGAGGGMYMALSDFGTVRNPYIEGCVEVDFRLGPALALTVGGRYMHLMVPTGTLYEGFSTSIGISYDLKGSKKGSDVKGDYKVKPVFPLFYSYYDKHPIGEIVVSNRESLPLEKVTIYFYVKQYMDGPRTCGELQILPAGKNERIPLYALFNHSIFRVTEGTKTAGEIIIEYFYVGTPKRVSIPVTVHIYNRNAMTWDDDRKAAAFITAKDPIIQSFSKNVLAILRNEKFPFVSENFRNAFALFQALATYNVNYSVDPQTPYLSFSNTDEAIDYLQFPAQTLAYRAGDCDDLSVLYAALLEAIGIPAALITTPGHIYVAFDSGISPETAEKVFDVQSDIIVIKNKVWVPVEVTLIKEGFVRAWKTGAQEWIAAKQSGKEGLYVVREAWETYEPVGLVEGGGLLAFPSSEQIVESYKKETGRFLNNHLEKRVEYIQKEGEKAYLSAEQIANRIGIMYAQCGLLDKAIEQFKIASQKNRYIPAITNLGNVLYLKGEIQGALQHYEKALALAPASSTALMGIARCLYVLGDTTRMNEVIAQLKNIAPSATLPSEIAIATVPKIRASEFSMLEDQLWDE
ncbi:MAG: tetratricopeptide repeat protein [Treponemataceae bacterium]|nr:tetratricopeptide repeat protein [Treponemataceae bacterium]